MLPTQSILIPFLLLLLVSCASETTTTTTTTTTTSTSTSNNNQTSNTSVSTKNVAAATNGSTVSSTFSSNESFTTDGDTSSTNFWKGGSSGDEIKVTFNKAYSISEITIYTNNTSLNTSNGVTTSGIRVFLSPDDVTYSEVGISFGINAPISCYSFNLGNSKIQCTFSKVTTSSYLKVVMTSDFSSTEIYEIEAQGS